jgi:hypothetical protein
MVVAMLTRLGNHAAPIGALIQTDISSDRTADVSV